MNNKELLKGLEAGLKSITVEDLGEGILQPAKFDVFVEKIKDESVVLKDVRFEEMTSQRMDIDTIEFGQRILGAIAADGSTSADTDPNFDTNKLEAVLAGGKFSLQDAAARRNIETKNLESTLLSLGGTRVQADLEELGFLGDVTSEDPYLKLTDGWIKRAGHQLTSAEDLKTNTSLAVDLFDEAIETIPKAYLKNKTAYKFYVSYDVYDNYKKYLRSKDTNLGDEVMLGKNGLTYDGIEVVHVPVLDTVEGEAFVLLVHPKNLVWGLFHEVTFEPDRVAAKRRTDYHVTVEPAFNYENTDAAVAIKISNEVA